MALLLAIGAVTAMMVAVMGVMALASRRYHHAQLTRDRLQALQCAQAGLLWANAQRDAGRALESETRLDLGEAGSVTIRIAEPTQRVTAEGLSGRSPARSVTRRLEAVWPREETRP